MFKEDGKQVVLISTRGLLCPGGVKHTAWLRADSTLCSARPILSLPARDLPIRKRKRTFVNDKRQPRKTEDTQ